MTADFITLNGTAQGDVASRLMAHNMDPGALRPYIGDDNRARIAVFNGMKDGKPQYKSVVTNANATLRKDEWIELDRTILEAAKPPLKFVGDIRRRGLTKVIPGGMGKTILQYQTESDITDATIGMSPVRQGERDRLEYDLRNLPLPIIYKDFSFDIRDLMVSRQNGTGLDTRVGQKAAYVVGKQVEKLALGLADTYMYGGGTVYGAKNFPQRLTYVLTAPTGGWTPAVLITEIGEMMALSKAKNYYGPWNLYHGADWATVLDEDYSAAKGDITLRERILKLNGISEIIELDFLTGYTMLLIQMRSDVIRMVIGMDIQTVQWSTDGGFMVHMKILTMQVPQFQYDFYNQTGIVHAETA